MTDKQIIIDGYNLEYIKKLLYNGQRSAISTNIFEAIIEELERKEQECEELKEIRDGNFLHALEEQKRADKLSKTLTEIKEIAKRVKVYDPLAKQILQKISECEE